MSEFRDTPPRPRSIEENKSIKEKEASRNAERKTTLSAELLDRIDKHLPGRESKDDSRSLRSTEQEHKGFDELEQLQATKLGSEQKRKEIQEKSQWISEPKAELTTNPFDEIDRNRNLEVPLPWTDSDTRACNEIVDRAHDARSDMQKAKDVGDSEALAKADSFSEKESRLRGVPPDARDSKLVVNESAWKGEKLFNVTPDSTERVSRIEGWLSLRENDRTPQDKGLQDQARKEGGPDTANRRDAFHLIGYKLGGPEAHGLSKEQGLDNLAMGDQRINRSYMSFERQVKAELEKGERIYCQVDVRYKEGQKDPSHLTHRYFTEGPDGMPTRFFQEFTTKIDERPTQTANDAIKAFGKDTKLSDFYTSDSKEAQRLFPNA